MDPVSIISLIQGSIGLAGQCVTVVKALNDLSGQFKNAELTILSIKQEAGTLQMAWNRIAAWSPRGADAELLQQLDQSLQCGNIVMAALQDDLVKYNAASKTFGFRQRAKTAWNEKALLDHQIRIRGQAQAMSLLLQVINMQSPRDRSGLLERSGSKLRDSNLSALSIVPSRISSRISGVSATSHDRLSSISVQSTEMVYRRLSFENDLFTAGVYKRNYRNGFQSSHNNSRAAHDVLNDKEARDPQSLSDFSSSTIPAQANIDGISLPETSRRHPRGRSRSLKSSMRSNRDRGTLSKHPLGNQHDVDKMRMQNRDEDGDIDVDFVPNSISSGAQRSLRPKQSSQPAPAISPSKDAASAIASDKTVGRQIDTIIEIMETNATAFYGISSSSDCKKVDSVLAVRLRAAFYRAVLDSLPDDVLLPLNNGQQVYINLLTGGYRQSALRYAGLSRDIVMTKNLLHSGIEVHLSDRDFRDICLRSRTEIIMLWLDAGVSVNSKDDLGYQPLHIVCQWRTAPEVIEALVERGADIEARIATGYCKTPLQLARQPPAYAINNANVKMLLKLGAKDDVSTPKSDLTLHTAIISRDFMQVWGLLRTREDPNARDHFGGLTSVLLLAAVLYQGFSERGDDQAIFALLINYGANLKACDIYGNSVLHYLVQPTWYERPRYTYKARARRDLIRYLMEHGANCNGFDHSNETPLSLAVLFLNAPLVEDMLEFGRGRLLPWQVLRLRVKLHEMHSKSFPHSSNGTFDWEMSSKRDLEINDMLRLLKGERGFLRPTQVKVPKSKFSAKGRFPVVKI